MARDFDKMNRQTYKYEDVTCMIKFSSIHCDMGGAVPSLS